MFIFFFIDNEQNDDLTKAKDALKKLFYKVMHIFLANVYGACRSIDAKIHKRLLEDTRYVFQFAHHLFTYELIIVIC